MTDSIHTIRFSNYSSLTYFSPDEVDRAEKFERYPLFSLENALRDKAWNGRAINYYEIGANVGMSVVLAGAMLTGCGSVYAFEVEPTNYKRLVENISLNGLENTVAFPFGIGNRSELRPFYINERHLVDDHPRVGEGIHSFHTYDKMQGWHSKEHSFLTCVFSLDQVIEDFVLPLPTHVFIDAFGSEQEIIEGMTGTIERGGIDTMMVQIEAVDEYAEGENFDLTTNITYQHLISLGYKLEKAEPLPGILNFLRGYNCVFKR